MDRHGGRLIALILFLLIIGKLVQVNGYKWVLLKSGDKLPENTILIDTPGYVYVGRARHFDEILPAEISSNGSAVISSCEERIPKEKFEVLTASASEKCEWKDFSEFRNIDENVVRGGTAWNGEPIYIGASTAVEQYSYGGNVYDIASIYLESSHLYNWLSNQHYYSGSQWRYLSCNTKINWIDSSSIKLPNNTVSGDKSEDGYEMYVARLKRYCDVVTGQVIPEIGTAMAVLNDGTGIEAAYCQVLIGEPNEYTWISASDGEIPDFSVACGKHGVPLTYVARINKTIKHLTHGQALREHLDYDILVKNW